jgi:outer membrane protein assembly factor BamE (lipoprotein component of BamABCDE complex)
MSAIFNFKRNKIGVAQMTVRFTSAIAALALLATQTVSAEVLLIDAIHQEPVNSEEGLPRPGRGMTMDQVKQRFGEPVTEYPWVGEPPITRWDYNNYSVFFEHQYVLTSVVHH